MPPSRCLGLERHLSAQSDNLAFTSKLHPKAGAGTLDACALQEPKWQKLRYKTRKPSLWLLARFLRMTRPPNLLHPHKRPLLFLSGKPGRLVKRPIASSSHRSRHQQFAETSVHRHFGSKLPECCLTRRCAIGSLCENWQVKVEASHSAANTSSTSTVSSRSSDCTNVVGCGTQLWVSQKPLPQRRLRVHKQ